MLFVPALTGLGAPHWVPEARGAIFGLTRATTAADLARAALEGVAYQVADLAGAWPPLPLEGEGPGVRGLRVDGGMAGNDWFCQFQSDVLGVPVVRARQAESTALGAAMLAGVGTGVVAEAELAAAGAAERFDPKLGEADRAAKLAAWRKAVAAVVGYATP